MGLSCPAALPGSLSTAGYRLLYRDHPGTVSCSAEAPLLHEIPSEYSSTLRLHHDAPAAKTAAGAAAGARRPDSDCCAP